MVDTMRYLFLLYASVLPVYLVGLYIYNKDRDKEPVWLLFKLFLSGMGALFLTMCFTLFFGIFFPSLISDNINMDMIPLFFHVFFGVALIEEFSKWIFVYRIGYNSREFDHVYDMIVYAVFVSLGFACFENILYVMQHGFGVAFVRGLLSIPGHACDGIFMGYYLSMSRISCDNFFRKHYFLMSIFIPVLLHGIYDFCLFSGKVYFILLFFVFIIVLYVRSVKTVNRFSRVPSNIDDNN